MSKIRDLLGQGPTFSFEFFPPKTEIGQQNLDEALDELIPLGPDFASVTYGAGGSTRAGTHDNVVRIQNERFVPAMAHLTCVGHRRAEVTEIMDAYAAEGIENLLALGGDPPLDGGPLEGDFTYATDLIEAIRDHGDWSVGVAAHPEGHPRSPDLDSDRRHLAAKLQSADFAITQFFFEPQLWVAMVTDLGERGCETPVIPGIMAVRDVSALERMAAMAGASIPSSFHARLDAVRDDPEAVEKVGLEWATNLCVELLEAGAPGLHIYCLNRAGAAAHLFEALDLGRARQTPP